MVETPALESLRAATEQMWTSDELEAHGLPPNSRVGFYPGEGKHGMLMLHVGGVGGGAGKLLEVEDLPKAERFEGREKEVKKLVARWDECVLELIAEVARAAAS